MDNFVSTPYSDIRVMADVSAERGEGWRHERKKSTGEYSTLDALYYRLHKGAQNSLLSNLIDSVGIGLAPDERMARFANSLQRQGSLSDEHPDVAESLRRNPTQNVGGMLGSIAEFGGAVLGDPLTYFGGGAIAASARLAATSATKVGAVAFGGGSALSTATSQYVNDGKVRYKEVALWGAVGGTLGGLLGKSVNRTPEGAASAPAHAPAATGDATSVGTGSFDFGGASNPYGSVASTSYEDLGRINPDFTDLSNLSSSRQGTIQGNPASAPAPMGDFRGMQTTPGPTGNNISTDVAREVSGTVEGGMPGTFTGMHSGNVFEGQVVPQPAGLLGTPPGQMTPSNVMSGEYMPNFNPLGASAEGRIFEGALADPALPPAAVSSMVRNLAQQTPDAVGFAGDIGATLQMITGRKPLPEYVRNIANDAKGSMTALDFKFRPKGSETSLQLNLIENAAEANFANRVALQQNWKINDEFAAMPYNVKNFTLKQMGKWGNAPDSIGKRKAVTKVLGEAAAVRNAQQETVQTFESMHPFKSIDNTAMSKYMTDVSKVVMRESTKKMPDWTNPSIASRSAKDQVDMVYKSITAKGSGNPRNVPMEDIYKALPHLSEKDIAHAVTSLKDDGIGILNSTDKGTTLYMHRSIDEHAQINAVSNAAKAQNASAGKIFRQSGEANQKMLRAIAGASVGMIVGHNYDEEDGAVLGAIMGGLAPWAMGKTIGKYRDFTVSRNADGLGAHATKYMTDFNMITRPLRQIRNMGENGKAFAAKMELAEDYTQLSLADDLTSYSKAKGKVEGVFGSRTRVLTDEEGAQVANIAEGKASAAGAPEHIRKAAKALEDTFKKVAKSAYESGVWSKEVYQAALRNKYFPRIYDEQLLSSKAGADRFEETFRAIDWSEDSLRNTIEALTGSRTKARVFVENTRKDGSKYIFDTFSIKQLLKDRKNQIGGASTHLDHQRKINLGEMDHLMDQFRIRNPDLILDRYLNDVHRRIEHARIFGAKNERALEDMRKIEDDMIPTGKSTQAMDLLRETFYKQLGDTANSKLLKAHSTAPELLKTINGKAAAFEVFKLAYSQILQPTSAFVNGAILTTKHAGFGQAFKQSMSTFMKAWSKDPVYNDFAQRAASGVNVGLLDHISSATSEATLFGRSEFATNNLKWINSPQGFLKTIGFFKMEEFTQKWATHQGHALAENLIARNDEIARGLITDQKVIRKVRDGMDELGLDWTKAANAHNIKDMHQASLRFNRAVNFVDGARQLPHVWNSPYASMFRMYKTYAYRQGAFMNDHVLGEMYKGNWKPAAMFIAAGAPAGWTVSNIRDFLKADDREYSNMGTLLRSLNHAGGLGFGVDIMHAAVSSDYDVFKQLIGPAPGDALRIGQALPDAVGGNWKPLANAALRSVPEVPGGFKRTLAEEQGIMRKRSTRKQKAQTFAEEIRTMWNAVDKEKRQSNKIAPGLKLGGERGGVSLG